MASDKARLTIRDILLSAITDRIVQHGDKHNIEYQQTDVNYLLAMIYGKTDVDLLNICDAVESAISEWEQRPLSQDMH